jgi:hypothetical protein
MKLELQLDSVDPSVVPHVKIYVLGAVRNEDGRTRSNGGNEQLTPKKHRGTNNEGYTLYKNLHTHKHSHLLYHNPNLKTLVYSRRIVKASHQPQTPTKTRAAIHVISFIKLRM